MALTAEQQAALRDAVKASPEYANAYAARDIDAIAAIMSAGRVRFRPTIIGDGTIIDAFVTTYGLAGLTQANTFLDGFRSDPMFRHVVRPMDRGELRLDNAGTRGMIAQMAGNSLPQAVAQAMLAMAAEPDPLNRLDVADALYNPDGSMK